MTRLLSLVLFALCCLRPAVTLAAEMPRFVHVLTVYADEKGQGLDHPEGVAARGETIVVADTGNGRLLRYTMSKGAMSGGTEIKDPQIPSPIHVQLDSQGRIIVLDGKLRHLVRFASDGKPLGVVQPKGLVGGAPVLRSFALDSKDNFYLLDIFGGRVIVTDPSGAVQGEIPTPKGAGFFSGLTVDQRGTVYLLDSVKAALHAAQKGAKEFTVVANTMKEYMNFPTYLTVDGRGGLYVVDSNGAGIVHLAADGSFRGRQLAMGWKPGLLYYPAQICLTGGEEALVADRENSRIQVFKLVR